MPTNLAGDLVHLFYIEEIRETVIYHELVDGGLETIPRTKVCTHLLRMRSRFGRVSNVVMASDSNFAQSPVSIVRISSTAF